MGKISKNMGEIFEKLDDLKNVFKFAERIVPLIQSLIEFMQEMAPLLDNINSSINDSTLQIKRGTDKINNVTSATELATTEILDLSDEISDSLSEFEDRLKKSVDSRKKKFDLIDKLEKVNSDNQEALDLIKQIKNSIEEEIDYEVEQKTLAELNEKAQKIVLALQVQDITAQQLASVNHLIDSVHSKLSGLVSEIDEADLDSGDIKIEVSKNASFNPDAKYTKEDQQKVVDEAMKDQKKKGQEKASQDEIDKLFS